jgi:c-di-GMP-binding flagellar brake protein YcgR
MNETESSERRRFHRILFDAPIQIETADETLHTNLLDISLKGALARIPEHWHPDAGQPVTLHVILDEEGREITMHALCAHIEAEQVGFLCDEIDMDSITRLKRLVELNIGDEDLLQRDLAALG